MNPQEQLIALLELEKQIELLSTVEPTDTGEPEYDNEDQCILHRGSLGHYAMSSILFGRGAWHWTCAYCGTENYN